ncbi:lipopolysaccharide biosynthesis protein [Fibrisoma limi BUZ 3]|uniref:Lipopolysaccharide biosynthesis protein n=1 Tax=Fibrisoma limi BUZ 3 TaxID=1185876 RepID=I2GSU1_9BACT|nr:GNVR domain-containing protein [Fibrisoma limi]CCH56970.1 lipopolysaccharide biosynthesis protein [Fibrisoma limi BUZ 3]
MSVIENTRQASQSDDETIEIRLSDVIQFLKESRRTVIIGAIIAAMMGTLYSFTKSNQYISQVSVMPEIQAKGVGGLGNLGSLAGLAGISLDNAGGGGETIRPDLYPNILQSVPFGLHMLKQPVYSQLLNKKLTVEEFYKQFNEQTLLGKFIGKGIGEKESETKNTYNNNIKTLQLTKKQEGLISIIHNSVTATFDKKTGIMSISAEMPDPVVAASTAQLALEYLTNYVTSYRTEKARQQVFFLTRQLREAKNRYQASEYALSSYRDRNRSLYLNTAKIEEQRLQADFILAQGVYNDLSKQLEQAKIKVAEEAPVFKTLEPPRVPLIKSSPKRTLIIIGLTVFGAFLGLIVHFTRKVILGKSHR